MYKVKKYLIEAGDHTLVLDADDITEILEVKFISHDGSISDPVSPVEIPGETPPEIYYQYTYPISSEGINGAIIKSVTQTDTYIIGDLTPLITCLVDKVINEDFNCALQSKIRAIELYIINSEHGLATEVFNSALLTCQPCTVGMQPTEIEYNIHIVDNMYIIN
jgi:hypothetical protein